MKASLYSRIRTLAAQHTAHVRELRHCLHQIPEASLEEHKTSALLRTELAELGLKVKAGLGGTGLFATLENGSSQKYVVLRADIDGLPVHEASHAPYHSLHPGYAHCCGHDGHAACLIGAARVLGELKPELNGRIGFLFQPAEENSRGAQEIIEAGIFCKRLPDAIIALHAWPDLALGHVACKTGAMMAASDSFTITVAGKGGHGARPHQARNPMLAMARIAPALAALTNHERVVSPCVFNVGEKSNVIAETGIIQGTLRTLSEATRQSMMQRIFKITERACSDLDMRGEVNFEIGCPAVVTDPALYDIFQAVGRKSLGPEKVITLDAPSMGSEDFAYYLNHIPGLLFRLGMGKDGPELHNPMFDFNDEALTTGITMLSAMAMRICQD
jgi:amidohydrolase